MVIDPATFAWQHAALAGRRTARRVVYEMHIGTFTPEGTWVAAQRELPALADLGVTILEVMPVHDFAGTVRLGLRRRGSLRADPIVRRPLTTFVGSSTRRIGLGWHDPQHGLQPSGSRRLPCVEYSEAIFSERLASGLGGEADELDDALAGPVHEFYVATRGTR